MAINPDDLQRRLCDQLCASVRVEQRPDGELMLQADFEFPDGTATRSTCRKHQGASACPTGATR